MKVQHHKVSLSMGLRSTWARARYMISSKAGQWKFRKRRFEVYALMAFILVGIFIISPSRSVKLADERQHPRLSIKLAEERQHPRQSLTPINPPPSVLPIINHKVFRQVQACLINSPDAPDDKPRLLHDPQYTLPDDVEQHYREMLEITASLRNIPLSTYAGWSGPWMENHFISEFCCDKPLSFFGGLVPLFIQWTDLWHLYKETWYDHVEGRNFISKLRKDVIYVALSQHDEGLYHIRQYFRPEDNWNIFVLSGGGFGHVALPIFMRELQFTPVNRDAPNHFVFAGNLVSYPVRHEMKRILEETSVEPPYFSFRMYSGKHWKKVMRSGLLNLVPRGYGRSSFRLAEAVQMGCIPVYLWDDDDWSPYKGTEAHISNFGYSVKITEFKDFIKEITRNLRVDKNHLKIDEKLAKMRKVQDSHYTIPGLLQRLHYFFQGDPRSDLSCQRQPDTNVI